MVCTADSVVSEAATERIQTTTGGLVDATRGGVPTKTVAAESLMTVFWCSRSLFSSILQKASTISEDLALPEAYPPSDPSSGEFFDGRRTMFLIVSVYGKRRKSSWIFRNSFACFWNAAPGTQLGTCRKMGSKSTRYIPEAVRAIILPTPVSARLTCGSSVSLMSRPYATDMAIPPTILEIISFQVEVDGKLRDLLSCDRQKVLWVLQQLG